MFKEELGLKELKNMRGHVSLGIALHIHKFNEKVKPKRGDNKPRDADEKEKSKKIITKFTKYFPLNTTRERIYHECANAGFREAHVTNRPPSKERVWPNMSKVCRFLKSVKRNTGDCFHMKDVIEELVKKGKLVRFTKDGSSSKDIKKYKSAPQKSSRPNESPKRKRSPNRGDTYPWISIEVVEWKEVEPRKEDDSQKGKYPFIGAIMGGFPRPKEFSKGTH